jgi:hypothetical protein
MLNAGVTNTADACAMASSAPAAADASPAAVAAAACRCWQALLPGWHLGWLGLADVGICFSCCACCCWRCFLLLGCCIEAPGATALRLLPKSCLVCWVELRAVKGRVEDDLAFLAEAFVEITFVPLLVFFGMLCGLEVGMLGFASVPGKK